MNNFVTRTLSGFLFIVVVMGSILLHSYTFAAVFALICGLAVLEFHSLTNQQTQVKVSRWLGFGGAVLLFATSFLYASGTLRYPVSLFMVFIS